jgi:predicted type IV restriction endonuclease
MPNISNKVAQRLSSEIKRFRLVLDSAKSRDINESDTSIIVTDMLSDIFGYEKYSEITSEYAVRDTYCDLAIKIDEQVQILIEIKAIGHELKDTYIKQAVNYAVNQGVDWVILTNGLLWRIYKVIFKKPVDKDLVAEFDFTEPNSKSISGQVELMFMLSKEGWQKSAIDRYHEQKKALDRFFIGALIISKPILGVIRRELKRISPDVKIDCDQIKDVAINEIIKREILEGEKAEEAHKRIARSLNHVLKSKAKQKADLEVEDAYA